MIRQVAEELRQSALLVTLVLQTSHLNLKAVLSNSIVPVCEKMRVSAEVREPRCKSSLLSQVPLLLPS